MRLKLRTRPSPAVNRTSPESNGAKLANPIVKIKKETEMNVESVVYRLNAIGLNPFPTSLPDPIRRATVTRDWISKQDGGPPQGGCPPIDRTQFKHTTILRFFDFDFNPHLPKNPGDPASSSTLAGFFPTESLTAEEWKQQSPERSGANPSKMGAADATIGIGFE
ncbi:hypothetical protein FB451DRAFT_1509128 [Mycena latifolia]|nr:hypothetical protein FB451DRAFT_1509128 [Mycena latifolia]